MARTLTSATATEAAKGTGAFPRRILEVQFASGTKYYSTEALSIANGDPVDAQGRIISMGSISQSGQPGKAGSVGDMQIVFADPDQFFKAKNETKPGIQTVDAFLYIWFEGTSWALDKVLDFGGTLTAPMIWNEQTATFSATMKGFEHKYDIDIGKVATTTIFPDMSCTECENNLIPIVYGNPVYRVPACVIDRPGQCLLATGLLITDDTFITNATAAESGFTVTDVTSPIDVIVGGGGMWEKVSGYFGTAESTVFTMTERGFFEGDKTDDVLDTGTTAGTFASGGFTYLTIPEADLTTPATSRVNNAIAVKHGGTWYTWLVTHWGLTGVNRAVLMEPDGITLPSGGGEPYRLLNISGMAPVFSAGSSVNEEAPWIYVFNYLPSASVLRIEAPTQVNDGDNDRTTKWLEVNTDYYTVTLDNKAFNTALGRDPITDDGVSTVSLDFTPTQVGLTDETIFVSQVGIDSLSTAPAIINHLLTNKHLGNVPAARVSSMSGGLGTQCAFALLDEKRSLHGLCSEIAYQAGSLYFWDGGQANFKGLTRPMAGSVLTLTRDDYSNNQRLRIEDTDFKDHINEMHGKFKPAIPATELLVVRASDDAITDMGLKRDEMALWTIQYPTSAALSTEFWLEYLLESNRQVTIVTWLNALKVQPGDVITLDIDDGAGNAIFNSVLAEVVGIQRQPGNLRQNQMERITLSCIIKLFDYTITAGTPSDITCTGSTVKHEFQRSGKLYLASTGTGRSLNIIVPWGYGNRFGFGASNINRPVPNPNDPTGDTNNTNTTINPPTIFCF